MIIENQTAIVYAAENTTMSELVVVKVEKTQVEKKQTPSFTDALLMISNTFADMTRKLKARNT